MHNKSYIYIYLDPRKQGNFNYHNSAYNLSFDHEPFYVGKGINDRCYQGIKIALRKKGKCLKSNKIKSIHFDNEEIIVKKIYENLSNDEVNQYEIDIIKLIGRKIDNCGPLTNICPGGEGGGAKHSKEWKEKLSKRVIQYDLNGNELNRYNSIKEAAKELNIAGGQISKVCKHVPRYNTAGGFKWEFENPLHIEQYYPNTTVIPKFNKKHSKQTILKLSKPKKWKTKNGKHPLHGKHLKSKYPPILQFDLENNLIKEWSSIVELHSSTNYNFGFLLTVLKNNKGTAYGFRWKFKN